MSELPDAVRRAIEAANGGDTAAFVNLFTPDGVVDDWGREFAGRDAIRTWSDQEFIGVRVKLAVSDIDIGDDTVSVRVEVGGDGFNGPGTFRFEVAGDRLERMTIRP